MKENSANSYDLKQAQQILSALFPTASETAREQHVPVEAPHYLRLSTESPPHIGSRPSPPAVSSVPMPLQATYATHQQQFSSWEECITWCMGLTQAEAAFVADSQGFVIASRGTVPYQGFEATGAELICSVEQLERIAPEAGRLSWIDMDFDKSRVVGFITPPADAEYYVLGLITPDSASFSSHKLTITHTILENKQNMD